MEIITEVMAENNDIWTHLTEVSSEVRCDYG